MLSNDNKALIFNESEFKHSFIQNSEFKILYPEWRSNYIKNNIDKIKVILEKNKIDCLLEEDTRLLTVSTNKLTRDPYVILKSRDFIRLVCRGVPITEAAEIMKDEIFCEIIKIDKFGYSKEVLEKRKNRLEGDALEALSMLTKCFILIHKNSACCIGPYKGVEEARDVILDTIKNVHPVYNLKILMEKKKLEKNPEMKNEDWERFLPKIPKTNVKGKKIIKNKKKNEEINHSLRKEDIMMEKGEFIKKEKKNK